jgi:hypothetical protein
MDPDTEVRKGSNVGTLKGQEPAGPDFQGLDPDRLPGTLGRLETRDQVDADGDGPDEDDGHRDPKDRLADQG